MGELHLYRSPGRGGEQERVRLQERRALPAEPAPDPRSLDDEVRLGDPEDLGRVLADPERGLRRGPNEPAVPFDARETGVRFERHLVDAARPIDLRVDEVGVLEAPGHVPVTGVDMGDHLGGRGDPVRRPFGVDALDVRRDGERVQRDPDGPGGGARLGAGRRRDGGDRLVPVDHLRPGERGTLAVALPSGEEPAHLVGADDRGDAGHRPGRRQVERSDPGMGRWRQHERPPEHAVLAQIRAVDRRAGELGPAVGPDHRGASATERTARTIAA